MGGGELDAIGVLISVLWVALAIAAGIWVLAAVWVTARFVSTRLERHYLPDVARRSRRRAGLSDDAGPWACQACASVNVPTADACYRCGGGRTSDSRELVDAATDPGTYHRPAPPDRFDPSLYRGPGAPAALSPRDGEAGRSEGAGTGPAEPRSRGLSGSSRA